MGETMPGKIISIEGNIGVGKSTLLTVLGGNFPVFKEDLSSWGHFLDLFYADPKRWSFTLQSAIMHDSAKKYLKMRELSNRHDFIFVERSIETCMVFAKNSFLNHYMTEDEFNLLRDMYECIKWAPDYRIYLDADVGMCMDRIQSRGRACERNVTRHYLLAIQYGHESMNIDKRIVVYPSKTPEEIAEEIVDAVSND